MGFRGFNCTIPHKLAVIPHLDGLGESAALMGAVNCVVLRDGRLIGENTDGKGFVAGLRRLADPAGKAIVLLGAGGAARAIAVETALAGLRHVTIVSRNPAQGRELAELLDARTPASVTHAAWSGDYAVPPWADIVVNATQVGLWPDVDARLALDTTTLRPGMIGVDVIPNPPRTRFLRDAEARGCRTLDGLAMLVGQGRIGIEYWTGVDPDEAVMRRALEEVFGN
jgi:shikimate dehydrogenase